MTLATRTSAARVTWLGHASLVISDGTHGVAIDPLLLRRVGILRLAPGVAPIARPRCDAVLLTHLHGDHCHKPSLRLLGVPVIGPPGTRRALASATDMRVREVRPGETFDIGDITIHVVPALHGPSIAYRRPDWVAMGFVIEAAGVRIYVSGDTDVFPGMAEIAEGRQIDLAILPIGGWGMRVASGHLDPPRAARAAALVGAQAVLPVHWGTLRPLGMRWMIDAIHDGELEWFSDELRSTAPDTTLVMLGPGQSLDVAPDGIEHG